jgi:hypothetical protein
VSSGDLRDGRSGQFQILMEAQDLVMSRSRCAVWLVFDVPGFDRPDGPRGCRFAVVAHLAASPVA